MITTLEQIRTDAKLRPVIALKKAKRNGKYTYIAMTVFDQKGKNIYTSGYQISELLYRQIEALKIYPIIYEN